MSSDPRKVAEFPDVENKLQAPSKKSLFERQKADAEAKRLREEAETKAVYEDFVKSFDDEDEPVPETGGRYGGFTAPPPVRRSLGGGGGFNAPMSGPGRGFGGSIGRGGSGPGSLGPSPQSLNRKRPFEGFQQQSSRRDDRSLLAFDDYEPERESQPKRVFHTSDDDGDHKILDRGEEKAVAKPTLRLASLPPGTSPAFIKTIIPSTLSVDSVRIIPPSGPGTGLERKSMSAIVTLAKDTPANDIDSTVNTLQNKYLGYGYYLTLHRHLSSAAISSAPISALGSTNISQPFGAKPVSIAPQAGRGHAPPPHQNGRNFAPPTSYGPPPPRGGPNPNTPLLHVPVLAPQSLKQLQLIHKTIESLLTHGPEFEALLMSRASVQREEKWAWLWDPRSPGGVWYRFRLWSILTSSSQKAKYLPLFEGSHAWKAPDQDLPWEYITQLSEFIEDDEYNSSDEDDSDAEGGARKPTVHERTGGPPDTSSLLGADEGKSYLNPLSKAKLTHLLARLPTSTSRLRKGDVARITAFAISHAGKGADEVVSLLISNVEKPFAYTSANPSKSTMEAEDDPSSAQLIALYLISDILSSSSTSGVRHAWRYRSLFEGKLKSERTFEKLGALERRYKWGRLRGEKWKRSVNGLLGLWEGWCVFPAESHEGFVRGFVEGGEEKEKIVEKVEKMKGGKWKAVEVVASPAGNGEGEGGEDLDGEPMVEDEDLDGEPMDEDEDLDGVPMEEEEDVDGEPMEEDGEEEGYSPPPPASLDVEKIVESQTVQPPTSLATSGPAGLGAVRGRRPRAVDMFADSDED